MAYLKRIGLFLAVNFCVVIVLSLVLNLLGIQPYLTRRGLNYGSLMVFCLIWGMGGAFISLLLSRKMAKWMLGVRVIDPNTQDPFLRSLLDSVYELSRKAGLPAMPEVGIYASPEVNAFATGPSRSKSLVAVSSGLMNKLDRPAVEGVLGHEVAHIANGDMVTMTLVQGVVNAFVMFLARVIATFLMRGDDGERGRSGSYFAYYMTVMALEMVFMILGSMVIATFSRFREFRADAGGAYLAGRDKMVHALEGLNKTLNVVDQEAEQPAFQVMKISNPKGFFKLFATHPPIEERIARLKKLKV